MAKYLISFPSAAMVVRDGELEAVGRDASAVIDEAKAAGVYVFAGGVDEAVAPVLAESDEIAHIWHVGQMKGTPTGLPASLAFTCQGSCCIAPTLVGFAAGFNPGSYRPRGSALDRLPRPRL